MTESTDAIAIETRFNTEFAAVRPSVPIAYDNVDFDPATSAANDPFVKLTILPASQALAGMAGRYRCTGIVIVQVFTPRGEGTGEAYAIVSDIVEIFRGVRADGVLYRDPRFFRVGESDRYFQVNVQIPYLSDVIV